MKSSSSLLESVVLIQWCQRSGYRNETLAAV